MMAFILLIFWKFNLNAFSHVKLKNNFKNLLFVSNQVENIVEFNYNL